MNGNAPPEVKPEVVFASDLVREVAAGKLCVPRFERPFVWRRDQMIDLLDSVRQQYPIGSLLVWETSEPLARLARVGHLVIPESPAGVRSYLLDGHQRLSTLAGVLTPRTQPADDDNEDPERWEIWYNADDGVFEHPRDSEAEPAAWQFRLSRLLDTIPFLDECRRMLDQGGDSARRYVDRVQRLARTFQAYKLPVIRIRETDLKQAVEIFARLNSKGQPMSADQMVSALAYAEDADGKAIRTLATDIDGILSALAEKGFGQLDRTIVLRAILATAGQDIYRTDWARLSGQKRSEAMGGLTDAASRTEMALLRVADFLSGLGVHTDRLLPYAMQAVLLSVFFGAQPGPTDAQRRLLERWFWMTSFTAWFASGNPSRVRWLIEEFRELAHTAAPTELKTLQLDEPAQPFPKRFDMRSARAKALLLMLLSLEPRDDRGILVPQPWDHIATEGPDAVGKIVAVARDKGLYSSPANRIVRWRTEQAQAKGWLIEASDEVLLSHGIPPDARPLLEQGAHDEFLRRRLDYLIDLERRFMEERGVTPPTEREPQPAPIDTDE